MVTEAGEVPEVDSAIERIALEIRQHYADNPKHGPSCACMDKYIRELRDELASMQPQDWIYKMPPSEQTIMHAFGWVIRQATRSRY